jgi:hypothetical protein
LRGETPLVRPVTRADAQEMGRPIHCNSGKVTMTEKKGPAKRLGLFRAGLTAWLLALRVGMLCVPTFFDATDAKVLNGQPGPADDESGRR